MLLVQVSDLPPEHADSLDCELPPGVAPHFLDGTRLTTHFRVLP